MNAKYDHLSSQKKLQHKWEKSGTYSPSNNPGPLYSIDTPPPTVSGTLHIGHIFSYTQTDIIARYKRMSGYSVFYPFGFDDNGLPTERYIEKKCNIRPHEIGRSSFIQLCLEQTSQAEQEFKTLWQQMGLSVDWKYWYSTISKEVRKLSQLSFITLYKNGYIYRKDEPALYCTICRTTVAQAELDDRESHSFLNDILFKSEDGNDLVISTTRPELLYSTSALLFHPSDKRYHHLKNKKAIVPLYDTEIPIYEDDLVNPEKGSGLVMVSTFGDQTDIYWYKKHNLPLRMSIGLDGKWKKETGELSGLKVLDARKKILDILKNNGHLFKQTAITHSVNVHERCKNPIEYAILNQWFIALLNHKTEFIKLADQIAWYPEFMKARYINWVENIKWDWCISRQRFYGIPFPTWFCKHCSTVLLANTDSLPVDPQEEPSPYLSCPSCKNSDFIPDTDVMDTWNTSSITPYICSSLFDPKNNPFSQQESSFIPMGMRPQAHDIIRTWAFYTIVKTWMHHKTIPWHEIVISGHVLSDQKEKLSKSKNNNPFAPENLLKQYAADAIRYWTAAGNLGHDIAFSENQFKNGQRLITKLWNAFRFIEPHLINFDKTITPSQLGLVNEWILDRITRLFSQYHVHFSHNEFGLALNQVESFFWSDFCDNYLELIKNQLFNPDQYTPQEINATKWTLSMIGFNILQLYAPYVPYITEAIYEELYVKHMHIPSIHQTKFISWNPTYTYESARKTMILINHIVDTVRKLKTTHQLSLKTALANLIICAPKTIQSKIQPHEQIIKGVTQTIKIDYKEVDAIDSLQKVENQWHALVLLDTA